MNIVFYVLLIFLLIFWLETPSKWSFNSLNIRKSPADELEDWLKQFQWSSRSQLSPDVKLPQYKFYSNVVETLLSLARKFGGHYQESILYLRQGLQDDRQFEKKLKEMILGTWFQIGLIMFITWAFIISALMMVEVKAETSSLVFILLWQTIGLASLPSILKHYRQKYFGEIGILWKVLYILSSL